MDSRSVAERILQKSAAAVIGDKDHAPLGLIDLKKIETGKAKDAVNLLKTVSTDWSGDAHLLNTLRAGSLASAPLRELTKRGVEMFLDYYSGRGVEKAREVLTLFEEGIEPEILTEEISLLWAPELMLRDEDILPRWKLKGLKANPAPLKPSEVVIQLNSLYTVPERVPETLSSELAGEGRRIMEKPGRKIADYDHPVPLFEEGESHELESCLEELDRDISFEKKQRVLPETHRVPVLLSVSVTHEGIDESAGRWIRELVERKRYAHLRVIVLTEGLCRRIREELFGGKFELFSVFGKYARHFNALKYGQLLLEKALGVRAGFKLDTDEGIRSEELWNATGYTWFETMCHPYWGGRASDSEGREVELAVNEGEYMNSTDIERLGYEKALRTPDVAIPDTWTGPSMFFQKGFAHGRATALYNGFESVEEGISHPVVKGGGYGITNDGLRRAAPFTFSWVGRAEDQQFYFSGLNGGIRGIFHPDLRIAHYKSSVAGAEKKTAAGRFLGDMYRLILFQHLAEKWGVKEQIDPMPGIFAGPLARAQAVFSLLYKSCEFASQGDEESAEYLLTRGAVELLELEDKIDDGTVSRLVDEEAQQWRLFVEAVEKVEDKRIQSVLGVQ
ncbi:MAG: hypothetical protein R6V67_03920 [Spirochaetia bacterium]